MEKPMRARLALIAGLLILAGCSKPQAPVGKWEGGYASGGVMVVARVEIGPDGQVKVSAPDIVSAEDAKPEVVEQNRAKLASDLAGDWDSVKPRVFDFDGKTFRKPGGVAPQMEWDKASNQMVLELYIGANAALPIPLRPVAEFHDNPWASG